MTDDRPPSTATMGAMAPEVREAFLARPLIARLATSRDDRPRVLPMWFLWDGADLLMETGSSFPNARVLRENPHAAVTIDEAVGPLELRAVVMRGTVEIVDDPGVVEPVVRRLYEKYVGEAGMTHPTILSMLDSEHVLLRFTPSTVTSWDTTGSESRIEAPPAG